MAACLHVDVTGFLFAMEMLISLDRLRSPKYLFSGPMQKCSLTQSNLPTVQMGKGKPKTQTGQERAEHAPWVQEAGEDFTTHPALWMLTSHRAQAGDDFTVQLAPQIQTEKFPCAPT